MAIKLTTPSAASVTVQTGDRQSAPPQLSANAIRLHLPVTVMLLRGEVEHGRFKLPRWQLAGVLYGDHVTLDEQQGQIVRETSGGPVYAWSGFKITLYKDAAERYWHALIGDQPRVYVVCRQDDMDDPPMSPLLVTVDYDEATAYLETDQPVLSAAITAELYRHMEGFVLQHYKPKPFKKRKRRNWQAEAGYDKPK